MPINPTSKVTVSSFQQCDGTNFTTAGVDNSFKTGRGNIGVYTGIGLTFDGKPASAVIDLKGSVPYGDSALSGGISCTKQFRRKLTNGTIQSTALHGYSSCR